MPIFLALTSCHDSNTKYNFMQTLELLLISIEESANILGALRFKVYQKLTSVQKQKKARLYFGKVDQSFEQDYLVRKRVTCVPLPFASTIGPIQFPRSSSLLLGLRIAYLLRLQSIRMKIVASITSFATAHHFIDACSLER